MAIPLARLTARHTANQSKDIALEIQMDHNRSNRSNRGNTGSLDLIGGIPLEKENRSKDQGVLTKYWCFTWNNPTDVEVFVGILKNECEWYLFQEETGESGTTHYQGTLCLKKKQRLTALKKWEPAVHWEKTKAVKASVLYCSKAQSRTGNMWSHGIDIPTTIKTITPRGWQCEVMDIVRSEPDDRTIHWFWEPVGNVGKSALCKYLVVHHNALVLSGKATDMFHSIASNPKKRSLILIDAPRQSFDYINYGAIECIKNGLIFSGKYEGAQLVFNCPHVIVFANQPPRMEAVSLDRWHIVRIDTAM